MKKALILLTMAAFAALLTIPAKTEKTTDIPSVKVKTLRGQEFDTKNFDNDGKPFVINFWATWCKSCVLELSTIHDLYPDWQDETGVKIIAVSIDDSRNSRRVAPFVKGRAWEYEIYLDPNGNFKRAMGISNPPHSFLYDGEGNLVWQHNGYAPGDEIELYDQILKLAEKE